MEIRRVVRVLLIGVAILVGIFIVSAAYELFSYRPIILAYMFPTLSGFDNIGENAYVYGAPSPEKVTSIKNVLHDAEERDREFYGPAYYRGRILICVSQSCDKKFEKNSKAKGETYSDRLSFISSSGIDIVTLSHEMSHMTFAHLVGAAAGLFSSSMRCEALACGESIQQLLRVKRFCESSGLCE